MVSCQNRYQKCNETDRRGRVGTAASAAAAGWDAGAHRYRLPASRGAGFASVVRYYTMHELNCRERCTIQQRHASRACSAMSRPALSRLPGRAHSEINIGRTSGCAGLRDTIVRVLVPGVPGGSDVGTGSPCRVVTNCCVFAGGYVCQPRAGLPATRSAATAALNRPIAVLSSAAVERRPSQRFVKGTAEHL